MLPLRLPRQTPPTLSSIREEDGVQVVRGHRWWASGVRPGVRVHSHSGGPVLVSMSLSALGNSSRGGSFSSWYQSFRLGFRRRLQTLGEPEVLHGSPDDRARGSCRNLTRSPTLFSLPWASPLERQKAASSVAPLSPDQVSPPEGVVITLLCVRHASLQGPPMSSAGTSPR